MKKIISLSLILFFGLSFTSLHAQVTDNPVTLGVAAGTTPVPANLLSIRIANGGRYCVYRWLNNSWRKQFYAENSHLFAIKIGNTTFSSGGNTMPLAGSSLVGAITAFNSIADVGAPVTIGANQEMTKRFTGTYNGNTFTVTLKITYNTTSPDYFIKHATIDARNIPTGTPITLAYGWDTYVNLSDAGYAFILPDIFSLNNNPIVANRYLTTAQMQSLRLVGARNNTGDGALIAFFPIGRDFDRGYSANPYNRGYCFNIPGATPGNGTATGSDSQYKFQFGPFSTGADNGTGVGYDNIPAGEITEIRTGLTFTSTLDGDLDYFWNGVKNHTANIGDNVTLDLEYKSHSPVVLNNVGFRVNHTGLQIRPGGCSSFGFSGGITNCAPGNEFYQLTGASVAAAGSATVAVPINIVRAGQWVVDGSSISNMTQTLPIGTPAVLTVATTVSLSDDTHKFVCRGSSQQFVVQYPSTITAANNVTVNLAYTGATSEFFSMPSSVTIPEGSNGATFTVTASPTGTDNSAVTITLSSTDQTFVTVNNPSSVTLTITPAPVMNSALTASVCSGVALNYTATSPDSGTSFSWSRAAVTGITPATGAGSGPNINETLVNNTAAPINVTYVYELTSACSNTQNLVVTVYPPPIVDLSLASSAVCLGEPATLTANVSSGTTTSMTYTWYEGALDLGNSTVNTTNHLTLSTTGTTYSVKVTNSDGCPGISAPVALTINPLPTVSLSASPSSICFNESTTLTATLLAGSTAAMTYTWYEGAIQLGTTTVNTYPLSALTATADYSVTVLNSNDCFGSAGPVTVTVSLPPIVSLSASPSTICSGESSTLTANTSGGTTTAMTYTWYEGAIQLGTTTVNTYPLSALTATADYSVEVVNDNGCSAPASPVTVTVNPLPEVSLLASPSTICSGESTTLTANVSDGTTAAMTYTWYEGAIQLGTTTVNTYPLSALTATADYSVTVLNSNDCSGSATPVTVTVNPLPNVSLSASPSTICFSESTTLTATVLEGSTTAMTYTWYEDAIQLGTTTVNTYPLSALTATANYSVEVLNEHGCSGSATAITVTVNPLPVVSLTTSSPDVCYGDPATLTANVSGGTTTAMTYTWYEGATALGTTTVNNYPLSALTATADYFVEVLNSNGCSETSASETLTVNPLPVVNLATSSPAVCLNQPATLTATVLSGSTPAMTYTWYAGTTTLGSTTVNLYQLSAVTASANYSVEVINSNGCSGSSAPLTLTVSIAVNPQPEVNLSASSTTTCSGDAITLTAAASGGTTTAMTYTWYEGSAQIGTTTLNDYNLSSLSATANYSVEVLNSNGCAQISDPVTVTVNPRPVVDLLASSSAVCRGEAATLTATVPSGSTPAMTYTWFSGATPLGTTTVNVYDLGALTLTADYSVEVLNSYGCSETSAPVTVTVTVVVYDLPEISLSVAPIAICDGESTTLTATVSNGSTPAMTYTWYAGGAQIGTTTLNDYDLSALSATANYSVSVINTNGCSGASAPVTVTVNPLPDVRLSASPSTICFGESTTLTAEVLDGSTAAMTYTWYEGAIALGTTTVNTYPLTSLTATADYSVTVLNSNDCVGSASPVTVTVNPLPDVSLSASSSTICFGESTTLTADILDGSTAAMTYTWYEGTTQLGTTTVNTYPLSALTATADYSVTVLNSNDCSGSASPVTVTVNPLPDVSLSASSSTICFGESTTLIADILDGSTAAMTYTWYEGATQLGTTTVNTYPLSALTATADYSVTVLNSNDCFGSSSPVTVTVNPLPDVSLSASPSTVCYGESTTLTVAVSAGTTTAMTYTWYEGAIALGTTTVNTYSLSSLTATADYSVIVLNSNDCFGSAGPVTVTVNPLPDVSLSASPSTVCFGESTTLTAVVLDGSTAAMTYTWYEGATALGITTVNTYPLSALTATADYSVTVLNSNNCSGSASPVTVTVNPLPEVSLSASPSTICFGESTTLTAEVLDGNTAAMTYTWYEGAIALGTTTVNTYQLSALTATADYSVTVLNSNDCFGSSSPVTVTVNPLPIVSLLTSSPDVCYGDPATLTVDVSGGTTTAMTYTWYEGATQLGTTTVNTYPLSSLTVTADYSVTVLNSNGCSETSTPATITVNLLPVVSLSASSTSVCIGESPILTAEVSGGTTTLMYYIWYENTTSMGVTSVDNFYLSAMAATADYYVEVINNNGCIATSASITITANPLPVVDLSVSSATICFGESTTLTAEVSGGTTTVMTYVWYGSAGLLDTTTENTYPISNLEETSNYYVRVTNSDGCLETSEMLQVTVNPLPDVQLSVSSSTICSGESTTLTAEVLDGSTAAMTYTWYEGTNTLGTTTVNTYSLSALTATADYSVTVLNSNDCSDSAGPVTVTVNPLPEVSLSASASTLCSGESTTLTADVLGGSTAAMTYTWYEGATQLGTTTVNTYPLSALTTTADYSVEVLNENGCSGSATVITVTVNPLPEVSLSASYSTICSDESTTLTADILNGNTAAMTYTWYEGAIQLGTTTVNTYPLSSLTATADYSVIVLNSHGCSSSAGPVTVTVNPLPHLVVSPDVAECYGTTLDISATITNISGTLTWYSDPNYTSAIVTANTMTLTPATTTVYYVEAVSEHNCSVRDSVKVTINPLPVLIISNSNICSGESVTVTASTVDDTDVLNWYEDFLQTQFLGTTSFTIASLTTDTTFYVKATSIHHCVSQGSLSISVAQPPELKAMDDLFVCYGTILTLTTDHYDADNITWNVPQTTFSHTSSSSYVITASRQYCPDVQDTVYITVGDLLHLNPTVLPDFERNRYYEQQLQSNADSPFYTIVSGLLPNGMTLHNDGTIKGVCAFGTYDDQIYTFTVEVTDSNGCSVSNDYSLAGNLFIPVVFSPNNDGVNDHFMKGYRVIIYDRLGRKIFEGDDGWDGTEKDREAPSDAYFYVLRYIDKKGRETHPAGSISLVR